MSHRWKYTGVRARAAGALGAALLTFGLLQVAGTSAAPAGVVDGDGLELSRTEQPIAPGAELTEFRRLESDKWLSAYALSVDLTSELRVDYLSPGSVAAAATVSDLVERHDPGEGRTTVAAINGDFFDFGSWAPLGPGVAQGELTQSSSDGATTAVGIGPDGAGRILDLYFDGTLTLPDGTTAPLDGYNSARVPDDGIGVYTAQWGETSRTLPVAGAERTAEVVVTDGQVTAVSQKPGAGAIPDDAVVLLGRGEGADALGSLTAGDTVDVAYQPRTGDGGPMPRTAIGGRELLVVDGEPQDWEGRGNNEAAPRTAVGFSRDGQEMFVLSVDGRQADSGGATLTELGVMMADLGAHNAVNLDGGGSATLLARAPGADGVELVNDPSDGWERPVPNGLAITAPVGSGLPAGYRVTTTADPDTAPTLDTVPGGHPDRVFPGLSRRLTAFGYDETFGPARVDGVDQPRWQSGDPEVGTVSDDGVFTALRPGTTEVTASGPDGATGATKLTVLGELARITPTARRVALADPDAEATFGIVGQDEVGDSAPVEPGDVDLTYDASLFTVEPDAASGGFTVTAASDEEFTAGTVTARVGDVTTTLAVTVGLEDRGVADFEDAASWTFSHARADGSLAPEPDGREGTALRMTYDFGLSTGTRAAYATPPADIPVEGQPSSFTLWLRGDGNGAWPSLHLRDAQGTDHVLRGAYVTWQGWRPVTFEVPEGVAYPVVVHRFYLAETRADVQYTGEVVVDELRAQIPPEVDLPEEPPAVDPLVATAADVAGRDWRFAVVSDAQFVAREPDSEAVHNARRTLREVRAADPDFVIINGDWVDEGTAADLAFARQVVEEELGDAVPWFYVPGNHEVEGGSIEDFEAEFGDAQLTFDHRGTRFVTLDTSSLTIRGGGFTQVRELREQLDAAAADPSVGAVVVVAHVPPRDPTAQPASQLTDRVEADLLEDWLADFRRETGKGAVFLGAHVGVFDGYHREGVPYLVNGNAGKAPAAPPDEGGFTGWSLVGVDEVSPAEQAAARRAPHQPLPDWLSVQTRPHVDELAITAPEALGVGETAQAGATLTQQGGSAEREVPVTFPVSADWSGSDGLYLGPAGEAGQDDVAAFDPVTGTVTGLREGQVELVVEVSGVEQRTTVTVGP